MKFVLLFLLLSPTLLLLSFSRKKTTRIVFFGDSITEAGVRPGGYIARLRDSLEARPGKRKYELLGAGIGGNKVYDLYLRLDKDVLRKKPDVVVLFVGVNDVWHRHTFGTGTDVPKFRQFYAALIERMQEQGIRVIACTPACVGERRGCLNAMDKELDEIAGIIRQEAAAHGCSCCDFRRSFTAYFQEKNTEDCEQGLLTSDGVHLNDAGNGLVAGMLLPLLAKGKNESMTAY